VARALAVRDPFPSDLLLGSNGVMLAPNKDGKLIGTKPATLDQVAPPEFLDDAQNPLFARPQLYDDLSLGMGRKIQLQAKDRGYFYAWNADLTMSHKWLKGPAVTTGAPATTDAPTAPGLLRDWRQPVHAGGPLRQQAVGG
jgi:hypothetical protein